LRCEKEGFGGESVVLLEQEEEDDHRDQASKVPMTPLFLERGEKSRIDKKDEYT